MPSSAVLKFRSGLKESDQPQALRKSARLIEMAQLKEVVSTPPPAKKSRTDQHQSVSVSTHPIAMGDDKRRKKPAAIKKSRPEDSSSKVLAYEVEGRRSILSLPEEMLEEIIGNLTTEQRKPLGLVCKRLRNTDYSTDGKTFEKIDIEWCPNRQTVIGGQYVLQGDAKSPIEATYVFKNAKTERLEIYHQDGGDTRADLEVINKLCNSVKFDKLNVEMIHSRGDTECTEDFITSLLAKKGFTQACLRYQSKSPDARSTRETLMQLPKMKSFKIDWWIKQDNGKLPIGRLVDGKLLDDSTLLHIVSNTDHAELCLGEFTGAGLLKAFEVVCRSPLPDKYVQFEIDGSSTAIDDMFALSGLRPVTEHRLHAITDVRAIRNRQHGAMTIISPRGGDKITVRMGKMDEEEYLSSEEKSENHW